MDKRIEPPPAFLNACHPGGWQKVGGVPLVARALFHLGQFGVKRAVLLLTTEKTPVDLRAWQGDLRVESLRVTQATSIPTLMRNESSLVYLDATHLMDPRLIHALVVAAEPVVASLDISDKRRGVLRAAFLRKEDLQFWSKHGKEALVHRARSLLPEDVDPFSPEVRGVLRPYFVEVHSPEDARKATSLLVRSQQKQAMDLPAQIIDPVFENGLTRLLCNTPITPNTVTFVGVAVAAAVAWAFWQGFFLAGALGMFVVEILDGVDGKLARTKLHFTKLGQFEDVIDYLCENGWYAALAVGLSRTIPGSLPAITAGLLILSDTADNSFYTLAGKWYGKSIDLFTPFDGAFRRIAGRRNIYTFMFLIGFSAGYPMVAFVAAALWGALTAALHAIRLFQYGKTTKQAFRHRTERAG